MAKLFVGCRVRILYSRNWPSLAGQEGRIVGESVFSPSSIHAGLPGWSTAPDSWGTPLAPYPGTHGAGEFCALDSQLEPILPEGAAPSEYSYEELMGSLKQMETEV